VSTKAAIKAPLEVQSAEESREIAVFQPPRLPYHIALKDRFDIEPSGWKALVEAIYPNAKTVDAIVMALSYCKARNLDPFKRPVHIVPMWDGKAGPQGRGGFVESIWPGIAELRTTAFRTGNYAGCDETEFGPTIERSFEGKIRKGKGENATWETKKITLKFPEWARITVYRLLGNQRCRFVGPKVIWLEAYATIGRSDLPNEMWETRAEGQIEKCAEAAGLRKAFPEEIGNQLTAEEMAGRHVIHDDTEDRTMRASNGPPSPETVKGSPSTQPSQQPAAKIIDVEAEEVEALPIDEEPAQAAAKTAEPAQETQAQSTDGFTEVERAWLRDLNGAFSGCEDMVTFATKQKEVMLPMKKKVSASAWTKAQFLAEDTFKRLQADDGDGLDIPKILQRSQTSKDVEAERIGLFDLLKTEIDKCQSMADCFAWAQNNVKQQRLATLTPDQKKELDKAFAARQRVLNRD
jgi:phage recombination protein Bet